LVSLLNEQKIPQKQLQEIVSNGIPDEAYTLRAASWKILFNYLPYDKQQWPSRVASQESSYNSFVEQFLPMEKFPEYPYLMNKKHERWR
jgi:hypothetical protein